MSDTTLFDLFAAADAIGDKYLTEDEILDRDAKLAEAEAWVEGQKLLNTGFGTSATVTEIQETVSGTYYKITTEAGYTTSELRRNLESRGWIG